MEKVMPMKMWWCCCY